MHLTRLNVITNFPLFLREKLANGNAHLRCAIKQESTACSSPNERVSRPDASYRRRARRHLLAKRMSASGLQWILRGFSE